MSEKNGNLWTFKLMVKQSYKCIHQEIKEKVRAHDEFKESFLDPTMITKQSLVLSFHKKYHLLSSDLFIKKTVGLSDIVIEKVTSAKQAADARLFLEEVR